MRSNEALVAEANLTVRSMKQTLLEISRAVGQWRIWTALAWVTFHGRFRRTRLGPLWASLSTGVPLSALAIVWGILFGVNVREFFPYMFSGYIAWIVWSGFVKAGPSTFTASKNLILNFPYPILLHSFQAATVTMVELLYVAPLFVIVALITQSTEISFWTLLIIPAIFLMFINGVWIYTLLGMLGARFRDVAHGIGSVMVFVFLLTPILWTPDRLGDKAFIAYLNPFTHLIEIVRAPALGHPPLLLSVIVVLSITLVGTLLTVFVFHKYRKRIVFWL